MLDSVDEMRLTCSLALSAGAFANHQILKNVTSLSKPVGTWAPDLAIVSTTVLH